MTDNGSMTDNGLSLNRHAFVLFVSVMLSVVLHFGLMYMFGEVGMAGPQEPVKAHITPENLPPVRIESFLKKADLVRAEAMRAPDAAAEARQGAESLPAKAEGAKVPAPTLPPAPIPAARQPGASLAPPSAVLPKLPDSMVRQEIAFVPDTAFARKVNPDPRWTLDAAVPRIPEAPDLASTVEPAKGQDGGLSNVLPPLSADALSTAVARLGDGSPAPVSGGLPGDAALPGDSEALDALAEKAVKAAVSEGSASEKPRFRAIDDRLSLALSVYETPNDPEHRYFRLDILRKPESPLPIMSKDVVFIQDISGSIGTARLRRSKEAMKSALFNTLRAGDRFNVFAFRDVTLTPSDGWLTFNPETRVRAETFVDSLRARGATDLFLLLQDLLTLPVDAARPLIAVVVTDGEPTVGVTETTRIIGEFSRMNKGRISVYSFGAKKRDPYFLDMLCYANRGENTSASGSVADIGAELAPVFESIRNPVMKNLSLSFDTASGGEVHPRNLTNLYADRTLTVYGRVPRVSQTVTCQLRGVSAFAPYDAVFSFTLDEAVRTDADLRKSWAERAMFDLLAEYAENPSAALLDRIEAFSRVYRVPNPYRK